MKIEGVDSCEMAENLRNKAVYAQVDNAGNAENSVLDYQVKMEGQNIGKVVAVNNYGATDVLSVEGERKFMLPYIPGLATIDKNNCILELNKEIFEQVVVYEN